MALVRKNKCQYYRGAERLMEDDELKPGGKLEVWDIEDLVKLGVSRRGN